MNTIQVINVKLQRTDPNVSWGFVVQGGKEFHSPLVVQKVNANSLADRAGVRCTDFILKVGPISTEQLTHSQAREAIGSQGNYLELTLQRGAPPRAEDYNARFDFPKHQLMNAGESFERAPVASPQVGVQLGGNRALVTPSYNSPMGLYSSQNISESLVSTLKKFGYVLSEEGYTYSEGAADLLSESVTSSSTLSTASIGTTTTNNSGDFDSTTVSAAESSFESIKPVTMVVKNAVPRPFTVHRAVEVKPTLVTAPILRPTKENINPLNNKAQQVKSELKSEPTSSIRLKPNQNPLKSVTKGRLLLLDIERSLKDEIEQIKSEVKDSTERETRSSSKNRSDDDPQIRREMYKYRQGSMGYVSKLDDPTKPSLTQSKTFQLLKETLDNNLVLKETRIHDSIANKTLVKRCTLNTQSTVSESMIVYQVQAQEKNDPLEHIPHIDDVDDDDDNSDNSVFIHNQNGSPAPVRRGSYSIAVAATANNSHLNKQTFMNIDDPNVYKAAQKIKPTPDSMMMNSKNVTSATTTSSQYKSSPVPIPNLISAASNPHSPVPYLNTKNASLTANKTNFSSPNTGLSYHAPHMTQPKFAPQPSTHAQSAQPAYQPHQPHQSHQPYQPSFNTQPKLFNSPPGAPPTSARNIAPSGPRNIKRGNRGSALLNNPSSAIPTCASCGQLVRGPFISAVGKIWCPNHFVCAHPSCGMSLHDVGFVEENGRLYCERDFANFLAPKCNKCFNPIMAECSYALEKTYHPECFVCVQCKQQIGNGTFHIEDGAIYCTRDFNALFSVKCAGCDFPIEPLDKFFEALNQKWHTECFTCTTCHVPLGGTFSSKGNKPYCKRHAF